MDATELLSALLQSRIRDLLSEPPPTKGEGNRHQEGLRVDIAGIIADLRNQVDNLDQVILALEKMSASGPKRRGRPRTKFQAKAIPANKVSFSTSASAQTQT